MVKQYKMMKKRLATLSRKMTLHVTYLIFEKVERRKKKKRICVKEYLFRFDYSMIDFLQ